MKLATLYALVVSRAVLIAANIKYKVYRVACNVFFSHAAPCAGVFGICILLYLLGQAGMGVPHVIARLDHLYRGHTLRLKWQECCGQRTAVGGPPTADAQPTPVENVAHTRRYPSVGQLPCQGLGAREPSNLFILYPHSLQLGSYEGRALETRSAIVRSGRNSRSAPYSEPLGGQPDVLIVLRHICPPPAGDDSPVHSCRPCAALLPPRLPRKLPVSHPLQHSPDSGAPDGKRGCK
mmetsp:Transcript_35785/g.58380  ORF Transcript_35785/g.58380 Transcript_35785/m.58380 type:complete len:236 (-) Transcript_35785:116-823(-)